MQGVRATGEPQIPRPPRRARDDNLLIRAALASFELPGFRLRASSFGALGFEAPGFGLRAPSFELDGTRRIQTRNPKLET